MLVVEGGRGRRVRKSVVRWSGFFGGLHCVVLVGWWRMWMRIGLLYDVHKRFVDQGDFWVGLIEVTGFYCDQETCCSKDFLDCAGLFSLQYDKKNMRGSTKSHF